MHVILLSAYWSAKFILLSAATAKTDNDPFFGNRPKLNVGKIQNRLPDKSFFLFF
jgi:hypothetical protein